MSVAKPSAALMRYPLRNYIKKHVLIGFGLAAISGIAWKLLINDPKKRQYQEFFKTYDEQRHFNRMVQAGVFDSVKPDQQEKPQWIADYEKEVDKAIAALKK